MKFEWDAQKAVLNMDKHGVPFEMAIKVFQYPARVDVIDNLSDTMEERWLATGLSGAALLTVVYAERQDAIRIISARKATRHEQQNYFNSFGN